METTSKLEECQSAYRDGHSTETALLKVKTDFLNIIDDKGVICLVLLDLSAAFDMITHDILLNRLKHCFGETGKVLDWIRSYLMQWEQSVVIGDENLLQSHWNKVYHKAVSSDQSSLPYICHHLETYAKHMDWHSMATLMILRIISSSNHRKKVLESNELKC